MHVTKYLLPRMDMFFMGPQTPACTIFNGFIANLYALSLNLTTYYLPFMHALQTNVEM